MRKLRASAFLAILAKFAYMKKKQYLCTRFRKKRRSTQANLTGGFFSPITEHLNIYYIDANDTTTMGSMSDYPGG